MEMMVVPDPVSIRPFTGTPPTFISPWYRGPTAPFTVSTFRKSFSAAQLESALAADGGNTPPVTHSGAPL